MSFKVKVRSLAVRNISEFDRAYAGLYLEHRSFKSILIIKNSA